MNNVEDVVFRGFCRDIGVANIRYGLMCGRPAPGEETTDRSRRHGERKSLKWKHCVQYGASAFGGRTCVALYRTRSERCHECIHRKTDWIYYDRKSLIVDCIFYNGA
ncbi:hypothetical protein evm_014001 [Chilo suppressalis]|nr:hypothetical protein evm_014001 [Chilo suppressalis]